MSRMQRIPLNTITIALSSTFPVGHPSMWIQHVNHCSRGRLSYGPTNNCLHTLRHCADAIISFADNSNVVGQISTRAADFCSRWIQSATNDYDVIVASVFPPDWAMVHKPVISTREEGHMLYTKARPSEPDGMIVLCHRQCEALLDADPRGSTVRFTCTDCGSRCSTPLVNPNTRTILGSRGLIKVPYPRIIYPTEWKLPEKGLPSIPDQPVSLPSTPQRSSR
jgi:hypothetical protein